LGPQPATRVSIARRQFAYRAYFGRLFEHASAGAPVGNVIIPYMDYCLYAFAMRGAPFRSSPWCGITMRTSPPGDTVADACRWWLVRRLCRTPALTRLFTIDPRLPARLAYLADPVERIAPGDRAAARQALGVTDGDHVVLVFGSLDKRKGIEWLLEAMRRLASSQRVVALLAGRQTPELQAQLLEPRWRELRATRRVLCLDGIVPQDELGGIFAAADSAWLGYMGHQHASGVFNLAAATGLPIIATNAGAIGLMADEVSRTYKVNPADPHEIGAVLSELAGAPRQLRDTSECERWQAAHSVAAFGATVSAACAQVAT
jgi:glycosyltransferase involved in cell wall biosynthesis